MTLRQAEIAWGKRCRDWVEYAWDAFLGQVGPDALRSRVVQAKIKGRAYAGNTAAFSTAARAWGAKYERRAT